MEQKETKKKYQAVYPTVWNYLQRMGKPAMIMYLTGVIRMKTQRYDGRQYIAIFDFRRWNPLYVVAIVVISIVRCFADIIASIMDKCDMEHRISCPIKIRETDSDQKIVVEDLNQYINQYNNN